MSAVAHWVDKQALLLLHGESLAVHGGLAGIRDEGLLDSALARPLNLAAYEMPDLFDLAASYGIGLAKNHPFNDGNKRVAFLAIGLFLAMNGYRLNASQVDATQTMLAVAAGELDEPGLAAWLRSNTQKRAG
jgi:death-on-curing protein